MVQRFRNYGLWVSIAAFIPMLCQAIGVVQLPDNYNVLVNSFLGILVSAGILNNPQTDNKGFLDDSTQDNSQAK